VENPPFVDHFPVVPPWVFHFFYVPQGKPQPIHNATFHSISGSVGSDELTNQDGLFMIVLPDCQIVCRFGFLIDFQRAYATTMPAETCAEPKMKRVRWFSFLQQLNEVWF
jgi:hypothetical protein